jgi:hypothetical protein
LAHKPIGYTTRKAEKVVAGDWRGFDDDPVKCERSYRAYEEELTKQGFTPATTQFGIMHDGTVSHYARFVPGTDNPAANRHRGKFLDLDLVGTNRKCWLEVGEGNSTWLLSQHHDHFYTQKQRVAAELDDLAAAGLTPEQKTARLVKLAVKHKVPRSFRCDEEVQKTIGTVKITHQSFTKLVDFFGAELKKPIGRGVGGGEFLQIQFDSTHLKNADLGMMAMTISWWVNERIQLENKNLPVHAHTSARSVQLALIRRL